MTVSVIDQIVRADGVLLPVIEAHQVAKGSSITPKITPVAADTLMMFDSQNANRPVIVTKADLTATLQGYSGSIFITEIVPVDGIVGDVVYAPGSLDPINIWESCSTDASSVVVHFIAEGGNTYAPTVQVNNITCTNLAVVPYETRVFMGSVTIPVASSTYAVALSSTGRSAIVGITKASAGPVPTNVTVGAYPGTQTALKAGDQIHITGNQPADTTEIMLVGGDACDATAWIPVTGTSFDIVGTASALSGLQNASVKARNAFGTQGTTVPSNNAVTLDQSVPQFSGYSYANTATGFVAFKGTEAGTVDLTISDFDTVTYSSPHGDFNITSPTTYAVQKAITCTTPGDYNDSSTNFRAVAYKASNASQNTYNATIEVADVAPTLTVVHPGSRLRSGGNDGTSAQNYTITATSNQNLAAAPGINVGVAGTWLGAFTGSGKNWSAQLQIHDNDAKGTGSWTFSSTPTNRAGIPANATISGSQTNAGFVSRDIILLTFANETTMNVDAVTYTNVSMQWLNHNTGYSVIKSLPNRRAVGTVAVPDQDSWCLHTLSPKPNIIRILDTVAVGSYTDDRNSTIRIEET